MKPETIDTITRHLKGIVAALEKEKEECINFEIDPGLIPGKIIVRNHEKKGRIFYIGG